MNNPNTTPAIITAVLSAGSTASPFQYELNVTQKLCQSACADETPVFAPTVSYTGASQISANLIMLMFHLEGVIHYVPCNCGSCCTRAQVISQDFAIPYSGTTLPTSVVSALGTPVNSIVKTACQPCGRTFVSDTALQITITD